MVSAVIVGNINREMSEFLPAREHGKRCVASALVCLPCCASCFLSRKHVGNLLRVWKRAYGILCITLNTEFRGRPHLLYNALEGGGVVSNLLYVLYKGGGVFADVI